MIMYSGVYAGGPHWHHVQAADGTKRIEEYRLYWPSTWWERFREAVGISIAHDDPNYLHSQIEAAFVAATETVKITKDQPEEFKAGLQRTIGVLLEEYE
jgi:hypothetical protein